MRIYIDVTILTFLINSLLIFGIYAMTGKGMIAGFLQRWKPFNEDNEDHDLKENRTYACDYITHEYIRENTKNQRRNDMLKKPLFNCPPCMASIWGTAGFIYTGMGWQYWIVWVLSLAGFNYIVNKILDK